jgi:hypothetical protein
MRNTKTDLGNQQASNGQRDLPCSFLQCLGVLGVSEMTKFTKRTANNVVVNLNETTDGFELGSNMQIVHRGYLSAQVALLAWGEVELFDFAELFTLVKTARRVSKLKSCSPGLLRQATCAELEQR